MTTKKPNSTIEKQALWEEHIQSWRKSGLAQKEWCSQNRIPLSTFNYWRRKLNPNASCSIQDSEPVFAKLPSEGEARPAFCRQAPICKPMRPICQTAQRKCSLAVRSGSHIHLPAVPPDETRKWKDAPKDALPQTLAQDSLWAFPVMPHTYCHTAK